MFRYIFFILFGTILIIESVEAKTKGMTYTYYNASYNISFKIAIDASTQTTLLGVNHTAKGPLYGNILPEKYNLIDHKLVHFSEDSQYLIISSNMNGEPDWATELYIISFHFNMPKMFMYNLGGAGEGLNAETGSTDCQRLD